MSEEQTADQPISEMHYPIPEIIWSSIPSAWTIQDSNTIPLYEIRPAIDVYLISNRATRNLANPDPYEAKVIQVNARVTNEGKKNGIFLLEAKEGERRRRVALAVAKNTDRGNHQTQQDAELLPRLREYILNHKLPLQIPEVYQAIELELLGPKRLLRANFLEWLDGYAEISCTAVPNDPGFEFRMNWADPALTREFLNSGFDLQQMLQSHAVRSLARNQTIVYKAFDQRIQNDWAINNGDYMAQVQDGRLNWALITLGGGLSEKLSLEDFLYALLTHEEISFDPRFGILDPNKKVQPFGVNAPETLDGVLEGLRYGVSETQVKDVRDSFSSALLRVRKKVNQNVHTLQVPIVQAIDNFLARFT